MTRRPPALARWLLARLEVDPALVGDLDEAFAQGRSAWWYWRQTNWALVLTVWGGVRSHKRRAVGAVALSLIAVSLATSVGAAATGLAGRWTWTGGAETWRDVPAGLLYRLPFLVAMGAAGAAGGWVLRRLPSADRVAMVAMFALLPTLSASLWTIRALAALVWVGGPAGLNGLFAAAAFWAMAIGCLVVAGAPANEATAASR